MGLNINDFTDGCPGCGGPLHASYCLKSRRDFRDCLLVQNIRKAESDGKLQHVAIKQDGFTDEIDIPFGD